MCPVVHGAVFLFFGHDTVGSTPHFLLAQLMAVHQAEFLPISVQFGKLLVSSLNWEIFITLW